MDESLPNQRSHVKRLQHVADRLKTMEVCSRQQGTRGHAANLTQPTKENLHSHFSGLAAKMAVNYD